MTNVARHVQASRVEAIIRRLPKAVRMRIKDNGKSFDVERLLGGGKSRRMGLVGMRERVEMVGGKFTGAPVSAPRATEGRVTPHSTRAIT